MAKTELTEADIDQLLNAVLRGTSKMPSDGTHWLYPERHFSFNGPGDDDETAIFNSGGGLIMEFQPSARRSCEVLARRLREKLGLDEAGDESLIEIEIVTAIGEVVSGARKMKGLGGDLLKSLTERMGPSVTVFPVAGLNLTDPQAPTPLKLSDRVVIGPLNNATELAVSQFAEEFVGRPLMFVMDAWWTEDLLGYREDPSAYEDGPPSESVSVIAVGLNSVGFGAAIRAKEQIEAILGAIWLIDDGRAATSGPPWILGGANRSDDPRNPGLNEDDSLPIVGLQVDRRSRRTQPLVFEAPHPNVDLHRLLEFGLGVIELVAAAETPGPAQGLARRVAAACRLAWVAAQDTSFDLQLLHLVVALESLVSDHTPGAGVTARFVSRLLALQDDTSRDQVKLTALYDLRSELGHQGFTESSRSRLAKAALYSETVLKDCVLGFVEMVNVHGFRTDEELMVWLDRSTPDLTDPFA